MMISLNGTNYHLWKEMIKYILFLKKLHILVFTTH